jgi:hypothetical protein
VPRRLTVALLLVPLAATACGGSGKKASSTSGQAPTAAAAVRDAVAKTVKAGSEHVVLGADVTASGQNVQLSGSGDFDSAKHVGKLHASLAVGGVQTTLDEVQVGNTIYVGSPLFSSFLPSGKKWLKLDLASAGKTLGIDASALTSQDPGAALAQMGALSGVKEVGAQLVAGTSTTHYRGRIDVAKLPASSSALVKSSGASFGAVEVWVGDDGYVHRLRVPTTAAAGGQTAKTVLTMTLSDFGMSVSASAPPAAQTVDASKASIPGLTG